MKNILKRALEVAKELREFYHDSASYVRYNIDGARTSEKERLISRMLLTAHSLEKGMCFEIKKKNWGEAKAKNLLQTILKYERYGQDEYFSLALNVLYKYSQDKDSSNDVNLVNGIKVIAKKHETLLKPDSYGVKRVGKNKKFDENELVDFFSSRSSVRFYKDKNVANSDIQKAYEIAKLTPTACNRQTCKVYVYKDATVKKQILDNQLGDQGWANKAPVLFVVTSDLSRFGGTYEHSQALIDGGLFAMNFVWGLHLYHIASCFKMFIREHRRQVEFQKICGIPENETPTVLILGGYYKDEDILCPKSHRFDNQIIFKD